MGSIRQKSVDYVEYISYMFIDKYRRSEKEFPTGVLYNKYMTLVNRRLIDDIGSDIRLPHCWYRWGDEVVRYTMPYLDWNHDDPTEAIVSFKGSVPERPKNDDVVSYAENFADGFIKSHSGREGVEIAIDEVYENVPYEFQNNFRMLRENLKISKTSMPIQNHNEVVRSLYEKAMRSFPEKEFGFMDEQRKEFSAAFETALEQGLSSDRLQDISECFWFYFCYHLRLDKKGHYNVPDTTLRYWRDIIPDSQDRYDMMMENYVSYLFPHGSTDPMFSRMLNNRKKRHDDIEALFSQMESS